MRAAVLCPPALCQQGLSVGWGMLGGYSCENAEKCMWGLAENCFEEEDASSDGGVADSGLEG